MDKIMQILNRYGLGTTDVLMEKEVENIFEKNKSSSWKRNPLVGQRLDNFLINVLVYEVGNIIISNKEKFKDLLI